MEKAQCRRIAMVTRASQIAPAGARRFQHLYASRGCRYRELYGDCDRRPSRGNALSPWAVVQRIRCLDRKNHPAPDAVTIHMISAQIPKFGIVLVLVVVVV